MIPTMFNQEKKSWGRLGRFLFGFKGAETPPTRGKKCGNLAEGGGKRGTKRERRGGA